MCERRKRLMLPGCAIVWFTSEYSPKKVDTSKNISDLWTKAVTRATLIELLKLIGRRVYLDGM